MQRRTYQLTVQHIPTELANALQKAQTRAGRPLNDLILELLRRGLENLPEPEPKPAPEPEKPKPEVKAKAEPKPEIKQKAEPKQEPRQPKAEPKPEIKPPKPAPARTPARKERAFEDDEEETLLLRDVRQSIAIPQHPVQTIDKPFDSLGLSESILRAVKRIGFEHPTPIQAEVIPVALSGRDVVGLAQTGSGKTAAFCLPLAEKLTHGGGVRGLIISPTREIALQTEAFLNLFGQDHDLETVCLIGGVKMGPQIRKLGKKPDIVVATPGRLLDHVERGLLRLDKVSNLVIDEADHMLDMGFMPQVQRILDELPRERQTMMFSATMPPPIQRLAERILTDPVRIDILPEGGAAEGIDHRLYLVEPDDKKACLLALLNKELGSTLVFIRRKVDAEWLTRVLVREGHPVERIHSDLSQGQRVDALRGFREGAHRILVATDIAARGIDVPGIQHIVNFDMPDTVEDYIHRAGRTARGTARGIVSTIASWMNKPTIKEIEDALGEEIARCTVPGVEPYVEIKPRTSMSKGRRTLKVKRR
ncbi:MAG TPA: DEAD/DEAH box helicase [Thermoanaerobaculia bacterium]|nr:DEAD/DEAH box helicase [Thermoanaerobaculia bacterium]